jgi:ACS family hexuronate transporter-like MFS transporter
MSQPPMGKYRWTIVALLFFATSINYIDRQVIGLLKPTLTVAFGWDNTTFGTINGIFQFFYAFGLLAFGRIVDKVGTKIGYRWPVPLLALPLPVRVLDSEKPAIFLRPSRQ